MVGRKVKKMGYNMTIAHYLGPSRMGRNPPKSVEDDDDGPGGIRSGAIVRDDVVMGVKEVELLQPET